MRDDEREVQLFIARSGHIFFAGSGLLPGALWGPMGPQGEQKYLQDRFLRKELIFNLFQKSEILLKPKYLDFGAMRNLGILA